MIMKYRVLHCLAHMNRGGAETLIMNIFRHIDRSEYSFSFLLAEGECDYKAEIEELGGTIYVVPGRSAGIVQYCRNLNDFFKEHRDEFDAVHYHTSSLSSLEVLYYARRHGIRKRIIHSHNTVQKGLLHNVLHWVQKPYLKLCATDYLACSQVAAKWLYEFTGALSESVVINNGIDLSQFRFDPDNRRAVREKYNIPASSLVVGHVGRFDTVKNHVFLLDVFNDFRRLHPDSYLICVGVGELMDAVRSKVHDLGLQDKVILAGLQKDVYKYLSSFDYLVFPSLYEGLPVALVESQASGVMTVCSDKVSPEAKLTEYLSYFELEKSPKEWAEYLNDTELLDRHEYTCGLTEKGYDIVHTVNYLTTEVYV